MQYSLLKSTSVVCCLLLFTLLTETSCAAAELTLAQHAPFDVAHSTNLPLLGMQFLIAAWVFILGSCFGSFLNVVIYRLPAGMSLGTPKSRCPQCETPLAAKDNIPVFGWLLLRGKCRYCRLPIPPRYPLIETACGLIFLVLLFCELLTGAENLPLRHPDQFHVNPGFWLVWFAKWDLCGLYLYHCLLLILVLATCMIGYDQHSPQRNLRWFGIGVALIFGVVWSELRPVPAFPYPESVLQIAAGFHWVDALVSPGTQYWTAISLVGFIDGIAGVIAGALIGGLLLWQSTALQTVAGLRTQLDAVRGSFLLVGAFLGWQACGMMGLIVSLPLGVLTIRHRSGDNCGKGIPIAPLFFVTVFAFVLFWQELNDASWMIGYDGWQFTSINWWQDWLMTIGSLAGFAAMVRHFTVDSSDDTPPPVDEPIS